MKEIGSYSSPFTLGHKALEELFDGTVIVQEKIDGSQFSFGVINGELFARSRNQMIDFDNAQMFELAVGVIKGIQEAIGLPEGYTFRGEYLSKPKHNTLKYARVPKNHIILFDIDAGNQDYLIPKSVQNTADEMNLEYVPTWQITHKPSMEQINNWLNVDSILGGCKREGLVFKNYSKYDNGKKVLMGKYVSDEFQEVHNKDWKKRNPPQTAFIDGLIADYATEARWMKARQHLLEAGELENEMRDIPKLLKEINQDVLSECEDEIKEKLFRYFWRKRIAKGITRGMPEWYKSLLAQEMLD